MKFFDFRKKDGVVCIVKDQDDPSKSYARICIPIMTADTSACGSMEAVNRSEHCHYKLTQEFGYSPVTSILSKFFRDALRGIKLWTHPGNDDDDDEEDESSDLPFSNFYKEDRDDARVYKSLLLMNRGPIEGVSHIEICPVAIDQSDEDNMCLLDQQYTLMPCKAPGRAGKKSRKCGICRKWIPNKCLYGVYTCDSKGRKWTSHFKMRMCTTSGHTGLEILKHQMKVMSYCHPFRSEMKKWDDARLKKEYRILRATENEYDLPGSFLDEQTSFSDGVVEV
jgi:hypothetical protein